METWKQIPDFPEYSVSDLGQVRSDRFDRLLLPTMNQHGILQVMLRRGRERANRSVALLVAQAFVPNKYSPISNTPIHLNGNRTDCRAVNLMWRSRAFAMQFHRQFQYDLSQFGPYRNAHTKEPCGMMIDIVTTYGTDYINVINAVECGIAPAFMTIILEEY